MSVAALEAALDLWHGPAFAEFADDEWARGEAVRLDELRLRAEEDLVDALLATGDAAAAVAARRPSSCRTRCASGCGRS